MMAQGVPTSWLVAALKSPDVDRHKWWLRDLLGSTIAAQLKAAVRFSPVR